MIKRILALSIIFFADVHVRADSTAVLAESKKTFSALGVTLIMAKGSLVEQRDGETIHLVKGKFLADLKESAMVHSAFASALCLSSECQALIFRDSTKLEIKALKGEFTIRRLGENKHYGLPVGMQVTVLPVTNEGFAEMEFPQSLPWDLTVKEWAKFYPGTVKEFRSTLSQFREDWKNAVESVSRLHQEHANREIASYEKSLSEERSRQLAEKREDEKMRQLFREKNFVDPIDQ